MIPYRWEELLKDLDQIGPKERIDVYTKILEYSLPKMSRTEVIPQESEPVREVDFERFKRDTREIRV